MTNGHIRGWHRVVSGLLALIAWWSGLNLLARAEPKELAAQGIRTASQDALSIFDKVRSDLPAKTKVPVRLPTFVPDAGDKENPLYANLLKADAQGYDIELGWVEGCLGGNACHYGTVRGSTKPLLEENRGKTAVSLNGGVKGYFINFSCGAHCDDSVVGWSEKGYQYSVSLKAGKKQDLINMANSAINAAQK